jgi:hypothetical protein
MSQVVAKLRQIVPIVCGTALCLLALNGLYLAARINGGRVGRLIFLALVLAFAGGLIYRASWARRLAAAILLLAAIVLPIGIFNPFMASDLMAQGQQPPAVTAYGLLVLGLIEVGLLLMVWLLDPVR